MKRLLQLFLVLLVFVPFKASAAANFVDRSSWPSIGEAPMSVPSFPVDRNQISPIALNAYYSARAELDKLIQNPVSNKDDCPVTTNYVRQIVNRLIAGSKLQLFMSEQKAPLLIAVDCNGSLNSATTFTAPAEVAFGQMQIAGAFFKLYDKEDEIAFIVGHELAHYLLAHDILAWDWSEKNIDKIYMQKWLRERDADMVGLQLIVNAGYDPRGAVEAYTYTTLFDRYDSWGGDPTHFNHSYLVYNLNEQIKTFGYKTRSDTAFPKSIASQIAREVAKAPQCSALWAKIFGC